MCADSEVGKDSEYLRNKKEDLFDGSAEEKVE